MAVFLMPTAALAPTARPFSFRHALRTTALAAAVAATAATAASVNLGVVSPVNSGGVLQAVFNGIQTATSSVFGMSVTVGSAARTLSEVTGSFGYRDVVNPTTSPLGVSDLSRINHLGEMSIAAAALLLVSSGVLTLESAIPSPLLPGSIPFANPSYPGTSLTLSHLLSHTSSLVDAASIRTFEIPLSSGTSVGNLSDFCTNYFVAGTSGSYTVRSDVWSTSKRPGEVSSYAWTKTNVALVSCIVENAIVANPTLMTGATKTALGFVAEKVWAAAGLTSTFALDTLGAGPTLSYPSGQPVYPDAAYVQTATAGTTSGTVTSASATITLFPVPFVQDMIFSTAADQLKLARALFADSTSSLYAVGTQMKTSRADLQSFTGTKATAQTGQGLGVMRFDGGVICDYAVEYATMFVAAAVSADTVDQLSLQEILTCPLTSSSNVWGITATGNYGTASVLCSDAATDGAVYCSVVDAHSLYASTTSTDGAVLGMQGATMQLGFGSFTTKFLTRSPATETSDLYGLWVAFVAIGCIIFTFVAAYITEYIVSPSAVSTGVPLPTNALPPVRFT